MYDALYCRVECVSVGAEMRQRQLCGGLVQLRVSDLRRPVLHGMR
jgi:hypothetical protein